MTYYQNAEKLVKIVAAATHTDEDRWDLDWVAALWEDALGRAREDWIRQHKDDPIPQSWFTTTELSGTDNIFPLPTLSVINGTEYINAYTKKGCDNIFLFKSFLQFCNAKKINCDIKYKGLYLENGTIKYTGTDELSSIIVEGIFSNQASLPSFNPMVDDYKTDTTISHLATEYVVKLMSIAASKPQDTVSNSQDNMLKPVPQ